MLLVNTVKVNRNICNVLKAHKLTVLVLLHDLIDFHQLILADPTIQVCDFLQAGNLTMLMLLGLSFGLYKFDLSEKTVRIGILAIYIISTFAGGFAMGKMGKTRKFLRGFMLGMLYFLLLLAISAGIYRSVQGGMQMMIAWILCGAGGMLGGMVS